MSIFLFSNLGSTHVWWLQFIKSIRSSGRSSIAAIYDCRYVLIVLIEFPLILTCISLGADVGHPGPGVAKPSVTGLVYSYDEGATRYAVITEIQQPRVEIIESLQLQKMMEKALEHFIGICKIPPKRVIFFRDGVSEGEYNTVAAAELEAIQGKFKFTKSCA
jgi:hypothetical protein